MGGEQLSLALAQLRVAAGAAPPARDGRDGAPEPEDESDDEPAPPPPPIVISEADFREKGSIGSLIHFLHDVVKPPVPVFDVVCLPNVVYFI